ncbi:NXPE family member 4, partial [Biomphalaria glabrata]
VIFVGDSNSRKQMELLSSMVSCVHKIHRASVIWHAPLRCDNNQTNMSIQYFPHNFPFYGSQKEEVNPEVLYSEARLLDSLPKHGRYVVHLHTFLHLTPFHFSILDHRLRVTREAIQRLLDRNPHVIIVYQSAHSAYDRRPGNYHKLGVFLVELQRSILRGLGDRVMFSFTWPMTVAVANDDEHPPISNQFAKYYLGYICGRLK